MDSSGLAASRETRAWCSIQHGHRSLIALFLLPQPFSPFLREPERLLPGVLHPRWSLSGLETGGELSL